MIFLALLGAACTRPVVIPPPPSVSAADPLEAAFPALLTYGGVGEEKSQ